jgi:chromosome segregation protein
MGEYKGAHWVRTDFHLHSPGAYSFTFPSGMNDNQKEKIVEMYVEQLMQQSIKIAAITDYQQIRTEWFVPIQHAALERGIYIYPGVELAFGGSIAGKEGLHLLAIFPYSSNVEEINRAIDKMLDGNSSNPLLSPDHIHRDLEPKDRLSECLPAFRTTTKAILMVAHPNDSKGLFKTFKTKEQAGFILNISPDAIESFSSQDIQRLQSTSTADPNYFATIASVENSDNHSIEEIGTKILADGTQRTSYLKLSAFDDLDAIRMALHDEILVCVGKKPTVGHTRFESLSIDGNGFLSGLSIDFSPELNVFVGGRGVGKSAILETLRYVLDLEMYSETQYRKDLIQYSLKSGGKATLEMTQVIGYDIQRRYRIERVLGEEPRVFEIVGQQETLVQLSILDILGEHETPLFFGQREIYEVTKSSVYRRRLLDAIIGRNAKEQFGLIERIKDNLQQNARAIVGRREKIVDREALELRLREIDHEINLYESHGVAEKLKVATALTSDEERLKLALSEVQHVLRDWRLLKTSWNERWGNAQNSLSQASSQQRDILLGAADVLRQIEMSLSELFQIGEETISNQTDKLNSLFEKWQIERQPLDEEIRAIKQEIGSQTLDPDRLLDLTAEREQILPKIENLLKVEREIKQLERERTELLNNLREARRRAWMLRQKQAESISHVLQNRVNVNVVHRGQRKEYAKELDAFFQRSGVAEKALESIANSNENMDGIGISEKVRLGESALVDAYGVTQAQAHRIVAFLSDDETRLFDLQLYAPDDEVQVFLVVNDTLAQLERLSAGQRATAILLILLTQQGRLLLVDQPEEDLDNRFVYDDIVRILREQKGRRQLISATHNPNIPVLGHAELITILEGQDERCSIQEQGAIDRKEVQSFVRNVMEGGKDAFLRRAQKYGVSF